MSIQIGRAEAEMESNFVDCGSCGNRIPAKVWSCPHCGDLNPDAEADEFLYLQEKERPSSKSYFTTPMEPGPFPTPMRPWGSNSDALVADEAVPLNTSVTPTVRGK